MRAVAELYSTYIYIYIIPCGYTGIGRNGFSDPISWAARKEWCARCINYCKQDGNYLQYIYTFRHIYKEFGVWRPQPCRLSSHILKTVCKSFSYMRQQRGWGGFKTEWKYKLGLSARWALSSYSCVLKLNNGRAISTARVIQKRILSACFKRVCYGMRGNKLKIKFALLVLHVELIMAEPATTGRTRCGAGLTKGGWKWVCVRQ